MKSLSQYFKPPATPFEPKPSLEGYFKQLAIDLEGPESEEVVEVSQEGAMEFLQKLIKTGKFRKKPELKESQRTTKVIKLIKRTYLNAEWLEHQVSATRAIPAASFAGSLMLGGSVPSHPSVALAASAVAGMEYAKNYSKAIDQYCRTMDQEASRTIHLHLDPSIAAARMAILVSKTKSPASKVAFPAAKLMGNLSMSEEDGVVSIDSSKKAMAGKTLPVLTKVEIAKAAQAIVDVMEISQQIERVWYNLSIPNEDFLRELCTMYEYEVDNPDHDEQDIHSEPTRTEEEYAYPEYAAVRELADVFYGEKFRANCCYAIRQLSRHLGQSALALERWMNASLK